MPTLNSTLRETSECVSEYVWMPQNVTLDEFLDEDEYESEEDAVAEFVGVLANANGAEATVGFRWNFDLPGIVAHLHREHGNTMDAELVTSFSLSLEMELDDGESISIRERFFREYSPDAPTDHLDAYSSGGWGKAIYVSELKPGGTRFHFLLTDIPMSPDYCWGESAATIQFTHGKVICEGAVLHMFENMKYET